VRPQQHGRAVFQCVRKRFTPFDMVLSGSDQRKWLVGCCK
jgi:hypothetical protein